MTPPIPSASDKAPEQPSLFDVWSKYEDIAMHFNDLLMRLRIHALGGVAALSTLVGVFAKTDLASIKVSWEIAAGVLGALAVFWVAIAIIDLFYYNRLLIGAVIALKNIETLSLKQNTVSTIDLSTMIEEAVMQKAPDARSRRDKFYSRFGIWTFYLLVFAVLITGCAYCYIKELETRNSSPVPISGSSTRWLG